MIFCYTHRLGLVKSERLLQAADVSKCRDPLPDVLQQERESLNWRSPKGSSPIAQGISWKRTNEVYKSQRGLRTPGEHGSLNQLSRAHLDSQRLKW